MTPPRPGGASNREAMPTVAAQGALVTAMPTQIDPKRPATRLPFQYIAIYTGIPGHEIKSSRTAPKKSQQPLEERLAAYDNSARGFWWED